jgi:IS5 family transposase
MRKKYRNQMPLLAAPTAHPHAKELEAISHILDRNPIIYDLALQDLCHGASGRKVGAEGMSAEQVVRTAILKQMTGYSYEDLAFHIVDSRCYRKFCRIGIGHAGFKKSALCSNIKSLSPETWEAIHRIVVTDAKENEVEKGREVRVDCTVVASDIHEPSDSTLLWDSVRVITRILVQAREEFVTLHLHFTDHTKRAKRRMLGIMNAKNKKSRKELYNDLLKVTNKTLNYAKTAIPVLAQYISPQPKQVIRAQGMAEQLQQYIKLTHCVIAQTERRITHGEIVPAHEKIVSIFEPHTDIIVKDRRETLYGHKVCLTGGSSNLIVDCLIVEGNPADSTLTTVMFDRQKGIYGRYPLKAALDGGFASKRNLHSAKTMGIKDVCFAKKRGIEVGDMCRSEWVYKRLRRFRAGIESGISWLKRCFGFSRCTWKSLRSFKSYVWASIVTANLLTLARTELT